MQLIETNFFDDVLDNETVFDVVIDDEAVNLLALVSDEWILSFSAVVSDLENDSNVVEALDLTIINFPCYFDSNFGNPKTFIHNECKKFSKVEFLSLQYCVLTYVCRFMVLLFHGKVSETKPNVK